MIAEGTRQTGHQHHPKARGVCWQKPQRLLEQRDQMNVGVSAGPDEPPAISERGPGSLLGQARRLRDAARLEEGPSRGLFLTRTCLRVAELQQQRTAFAVLSLACQLEPPESEQVQPDRLLIRQKPPASVACAPRVFDSPGRLPVRQGLEE